MAETGSSKKALKIVAAIICLAAAGVVLYLTQRDRNGVTAREHQWFHDLGSGRLFVAPANEIPPVAAPSGAKASNGWEGGVKAYVYSCGECKEGEQFTAYLGTYAPKVRQTLIGLRDFKAGQPLPPGVQGSPARAAQQLGEEELWVASPEKPTEWVKATSQPGMAIRIAPSARCQGVPPKQCYPQGEATGT